MEQKAPSPKALAAEATEEEATKAFLAERAVKKQEEAVEAAEAAKIKAAEDQKKAKAAEAKAKVDAREAAAKAKLEPTKSVHVLPPKAPKSVSPPRRSPSPKTAPAMKTAEKMEEEAREVLKAERATKKAEQDVKLAEEAKKKEIAAKEIAKKKAEEKKRADELAALAARERAAKAKFEPKKAKELPQKPGQIKARSEEEIKEELRREHQARKKKDSEKVVRPQSNLSAEEQAKSEFLAKKKKDSIKVEPKVDRYEQDNREMALRRIYREFDLNGDGTVGADEMLALGQWRRKMAQKGGTWTKSQNDYMMTAMGAIDGQVSMDNFVKFFKEKLAVTTFKTEIEQFSRCAAELKASKDKVVPPIEYQSSISPTRGSSTVDARVANKAAKDALEKREAEAKAAMAKREHAAKAGKEKKPSPAKKLDLSMPPKPVPKKVAKPPSMIDLKEPQKGDRFSNFMAEPSNVAKVTKNKNDIVDPALEARYERMMMDQKKQERLGGSVSPVKKSPSPTKPKIRVPEPSHAMEKRYSEIESISKGNLKSKSPAPRRSISPSKSVSPSKTSKNGNNSTGGGDRFDQFMANPSNVAQPLKPSQAAAVEAKIEKRFEEMKYREDRAKEAAAKESKRKEKYGY